MNNIENWETGKEVCLDLGNGIVTGIVADNICCQSGAETWRQINLQIGDYGMRIDSRDIREVYDTVHYCEKGLLCKDQCKDLGIAQGLTDAEFLYEVIQKWDMYSDEGKNELAARIAKSVSGEHIVDLLTAYKNMQNTLKEKSQKIVDLLEEQIKEVEKKEQFQKNYEMLKAELPEWTGMCFDGVLKFLESAQLQ